MAVNVSYLDIKDSNATPSSNWFAYNSTDSGNNTGWFIVSGLGCYLTATEAKDTAAFDTVVSSFLYLLTSEAPDTAAFNISTLSFYLNATEAPDTAAINAAVTGTMSMAATEAPDSYSQNIYVLWVTPDQPNDPTIWVPKNDPTPYLTTVI